MVILCRPYRAKKLNDFNKPSVSDKGVAKTSKDFSSLAPSERVAVMPDYRQVLMLNFNVNLDFGSKHREGWKRIDNEDTESGILSGAK